jgi:hypothetical protein
MSVRSSSPFSSLQHTPPSRSCLAHLDDKGAVGPTDWFTAQIGGFVESAGCERVGRGTEAGGVKVVSEESEDMVALNTRMSIFSGQTLR